MMRVLCVLLRWGSYLIPTVGMNSRKSALFFIIYRKSLILKEVGRTSSGSRVLRAY